MPKQKTKRASAKRFRVTKSGLIKRAKAYKSHILNKKSTKRKRNLRKGTTADNPDTRRTIPNRRSPYSPANEARLKKSATRVRTRRRALLFLNPSITCQTQSRAE